MISSSPTETENIECKVCGHKFSSISNRNKHLKRVHNVQSSEVPGRSKNPGIIKCCEDNCSLYFRTNIDLMVHLEAIHNLEFEVEIKYLSSLAEFKSWKASVEKNCNYIVASTKNTPTKKIMYYKCNRTGKVILKSKGKRMVKSQGSCKLNFSCTSHIKLVEIKSNPSTFQVRWIKTHYGHQTEMQHLRVPKDVRMDIASQLVIGASVNRILTSHREKNCNELVRENLLTSQDIRNIKATCNVRRRLATTSRNTSHLEEKVLAKLAEATDCISKFNFSEAERGVALQVQGHLNNIINLTRFNGSSKYLSNPDQQLNDEPSNKKIEKQASFCIRKKQIASKNILRRPNSEEVADVESMFSGKKFISNNSSHDHSYI